MIRQRGISPLPCSNAGPRPPLLILAPAILFICFICAGCLTPGIRYAHNADMARQSARHYYVPANWDYREHYVIPQDRLRRIIDSYRGTPYRRAGMSRKGLDCSGFVCVVYKELNHARLPRGTGGLRKLGYEVGASNARLGDLIFFRGGALNMINHVGICLDNKRFVHAATHGGVIISEMSSDYYTRRFAFVRRLF